MRLLRFNTVLLAFAAIAVLPAVAAIARAQKQSVPNPLAPRFAQVRERIDTLFEHRNEPPPPPDAKHNPFRGAAVAPAPAGVDGKGVVAAAAPVTPLDNLTLLQQAAATLKISGVFEIGGRSHLVINARPYKQGDVVQTLAQGEKVYLRLKEISKRSVTLTLNDAEMSLTY
jgi:hypothetical protein